MTAPRRAIHFEDKCAHRVERLPGSIWIGSCEPGEQGMLWFYCPCGCGILRNITVGNRHKPRIGSPSWNWNGSRTEPTLVPSVNCGPVAACRGWHGWLRDGYWEAC